MMSSVARPKHSMKPLLLSVVGIFFLTGCDLPESSAIAQAQAAVENARSSDAPSVAGAATNAVTATSPTPTPAPTPAPVPDLPPNLPEPAREVVKLAHGQMGEGVVTNFIANIKEPFHLDAGQIVYLRDLGLSPAILESLLSREQDLARLAPPTPTPAAPAPTVVVATINTTNVTPAPTAYPGGPVEYTQPQVGPAVASAPSDPPVDQPEQVNYNFFYNSLAPYGNWLTVPSYGYVWQPSCAVVNPGWRPYWNDGCWNWCDSGWYWNSSYSWGWAPFHYGNWVNAPGNGWCWVPGRTWAPSWVTFRSGGGYCGWAPLPPGCGWSGGVGLTWAGSGVSVGFGFGYSASDYCWTPTSYFTAPNCYAYGVYGGRVNQCYNGSTVINNYVVGNNNTIINNGIDPAHIAPHARNEIRKVQLADVNSPSAAGSAAGLRGRPGNPAQLAVYRPTVGGGSTSAGTPGARSEIRPAQFASSSSGIGGSQSTGSRIPGRPSTVTQPDRLPAPNPRTPAVGLHSGSGVSGGSTSLSGRSGEVRPVTGSGSSLGAISRPGGVRNPGVPGGPSLASRGGAAYSTSPTSIPSGRLEPRKAPSIAESAPGAPGTITRGVGVPQGNLTAPGSGVRTQVGAGRPAPGSFSAPAPRSNPRPSMSAPAPASSVRLPQGPQMQRMQSPAPVNMSRPTPSFNSMPARGGAPAGGGGASLQRPGGR